MLDLQVSAWAALRLGWHEFFAAVARLPALPDGFPLPEDGEVLLEIGFDEGAGYALRASGDFELDHDIVLGGLTLGRRFRFEFSALVPGDALVEDVLSGAVPRLEGEIRLGADLSLPSLPQLGPLQPRIGGEDGWLHLELDVQVDTEGALSLRAELADGDFELDVVLPGGPPETPLLRAALANIEISVDAGGAFGGGEVSAGIALNGALSVNPVAIPDDAPFAYQWRQLFAGLDLPMRVGCALELEASTEAFSAKLRLSGAEIELKPFAAIAGLAGAATGADVEKQVPIELPLRFGLTGADVTIASDLARSGFVLRASFGVGEIEGEAMIGVTGSEFRVGIYDIEIPLALPRFPFDKQEFDERYGHPEIIDQLIAGAACPPASEAVADPELATRCKRLRAQRLLLRSFDAIPQAAATAGRPMDAAALGRYKDWLGLFVASLDLATSIPGNGETAFFRITPSVLERLGEDAVPDAVLNRLRPLADRYIGTERFWAALHARLTPHQFQEHSARITERAQICGASMQASIDGADHVILENATLAIDHIELAIPFSSPNNVRADGAIRFLAFSEPLGQIDVELEVGISADMIYFSLKAADGRIPIPDVGRYKGGSVSFSRFLIGFGYTKRSLALAFEGEVVLPEQLVADLDTSSVTMLGIRLPVQSKLSFRLDLVPVPAPEVTIIVPVFQFNLDLRRAGVPAVADPLRCAPGWDGLQFIVRDEFRFALKHVAFSPVFGFLPALNWVLNGDLVVGNDHDGLAIVIDEWMQIDAFWTPTPWKIALPGFSDDTPFVNDCCIDLRVAGFGVHFHLQRPFPSVSPLALPEVFALFSDPGNYPVNPRGELANSLRLSILNTGISLPENLLALFPALRAVAGPPVTETINLGTFITLAQKIARVVAPLLKNVIVRVRAAADDPQVLARSFALPKIQPRDLLRLLPAPLQRLEAQASFAGFSGRAVIVLMSLKDARLAFKARGQPAPGAAVPQGISPGQSFSAQALLNFQPRLPDTNAPPPPSPAALLSDPVFDAFTEADLAISPLTAGAKGVLAGARLEVLATQQLDFVGYVSSDGGFALIAAADQAPLRLRVAGIDVPLPFAPSAKGRLTLKGHAGRDGVSGSLTAKGAADWKILPGMMEVGLTQATLTLASDASFALKGKLTLALFGGRVNLDGSIDVSPAHAAVSGRIAMEEGPVRLALSGTGMLGPLHLLPGGKHAGARMDITLAGQAWLFGQTLSGATARLVGERIELRGDWSLKNWKLFGTAAMLKGQLALRGTLWFPPDAPAMELEGQGSVSVRWSPQAATPADVRIDGGARVESGPEGTKLSASGTLFWQGRSWASGTLSATPTGLKLAGHTAFTLEIPRRGRALLADVPRLVLRLDVQGSFELDGGGAVAGCSFDGHWLVGARLSESSEQMFTLAAGSRRFEWGADMTLVELSGLQMLPGAGSLTIPVLRQDTGGSFVKIGKVDDDRAVRVNIEGHQKTLKLIDAGIPHVSVPVLSDDELTTFDADFYPLSIGPSEPIAIPWPFASAFRVGLGFRGGDPVVELEIGGSTHLFRLRDGSPLG